MQLAILYITQLLGLLLPAHSVFRASRMVDEGRRFLEQKADAVADDAVPAVPGTRRMPTARTVPFFELDAAPEALTWEPQTISVVLPCAEEREYAVNTVKAVFKTTPLHILHEIIVVDDGSHPPLSKKHLTKKVREQYRVKIVRHNQTQGLIRAKKSGGDAATGDIVVFFDCHVAPQERWYVDFLQLIGENYRRMVVPQITSLDVDTWTQKGEGGGMSQCYVTWDGDFKWGGSGDRYMAMLSGGLAGLSKRWWEESGGYDDEMMGWGGENIDQGVRMWLCGGEIVAAPGAQVAHMWRTHDAKTKARYDSVGDRVQNRGRAIFAWFGEFAAKSYDYPTFRGRQQAFGERWFGDLKNFDDVRSRLQGCRPFAWYLRRFSSIYLDAGILPAEIFMLKEASTGLCVRFEGRAGTSGRGHENIALSACDPTDDRSFWHSGNRAPHTGGCCSGLRAWNTDQCLDEEGTSVCDISGQSRQQRWSFKDGQLSLAGSSACLGPVSSTGELDVQECSAFAAGEARFTKENVTVPLEMRLYQQALRDHPDMFRILDERYPLKSAAASSPSEPRVTGN